MNERKKQDPSAFWQLSRKIAVVGLIILVAGCFFTEILPWVLGVVLGTVFTILRLKLMENAIEKAVHLDPKKQAGSYANGQFLLRQLLCIVVLGLAVLIPWINPIGTVLPMFGMSLASHWQSWEDCRRPKDPNMKYEEWTEEDEEEEEEDWDRWETYNLKASGGFRKIKEEYEKSKKDK